MAACCSNAAASARSQMLARSAASSSRFVAQLPELRLELRDPRVAIVRHHVHPGLSALLRDGARIARGSCEVL